MDEIDCTGERAVHLNAYIPKKSRSGETYTNASVHPNVLAAKCFFFLMIHEEHSLEAQFVKQTTDDWKMIFVRFVIRSKIKHDQTVVI